MEAQVKASRGPAGLPRSLQTPGTTTVPATHEHAAPTAGRRCPVPQGHGRSEFGGALHRLGSHSFTGTQGAHSILQYSRWSTVSISNESDTVLVSTHVATTVPGAKVRPDLCIPTLQVESLLHRRPPINQNSSTGTKIEEIIISPACVPVN